MKKIIGRTFIFSILTFFGLGAGLIGITHSADLPGWGINNATSLGYNPNVPGASSGQQQDNLIKVIKQFINRVLGLLALITLGLLLFGGFNMVTAAGDDAKYKKGFKILQQAAIGLAFIALAWLIVSLIFWVIGIVTVAGGVPVNPVKP
ncbi:MAG: hypothetical protein WC872_00170 [Candidatus Absconditabacterales bacterium]